MCCARTAALQGSSANVGSHCEFTAEIQAKTESNSCENLQRSTDSTDPRSTLTDCEFDPPRAQNRPLDDPKSILGRAKIVQALPRVPKRRPRVPKSASRATQERPKSAPRPPQERPRAAQERPRAPQKSPRAPLKPPSSAHRRPREPSRQHLETPARKTR